MQEFKLDQSIRTWRRDLSKHQGFEPGYLEELEGNLRDRIDDYIAEGYSEEQAFKLSIQKAMPDPETLADEYFKARTSKAKVPPWRKSNHLFSKVPMHFKIAIRNLSKRKVYATLNVTGLAVGICVAFLIGLYVQNQSAYDQHFKHSDRIYRVIYDVAFDGEKAVQADVGQPVGPTLKADYPEVTEKTRLRRIGATNTLATEDVSIESSDFFVADEDFFNVFNIEFSGGDKATALTAPNTVVLTEALAMKLFGSTDVVGEVLKYSGVRPPMDIKVTGVMKNLNKQSHLQYQALISYSTYFDQRELINWMRKSYTYILLNESNDIDGLRSKIPDFNERYLKEVFARRADATANLLFQPLTSIYLDAEYLGEPYPHGNKSNLQILSILMIFLLLMACINYVNLATAQTVDRAAEVGIRKTLGSSRKQLLVQFMSESICLALISGFLAMIIAAFLLPYYSHITGLDLGLREFLSWRHLGSISLLSLLVGFVAGIYPALHLTSFRPIAMLKGKFSTSAKGVMLRKTLIISQYAISSVLIIWILVASSQIKFLKDRDVGFDKSSLIEVTIPDDPGVLKSMDVFLQNVKALPYIRGAAKSTKDLSEFYGASWFLMEGPDGLNATVNLVALSAGYDFIETIGARFVKGRDFDPKLENERSVLINEAAVRENGWSGQEHAVKYLGRDREGNVTSKWNVVGVFSDFKPGEAYAKSEPMIIFLDNSTIPESNILIGITSEDLRSPIQEIATLWEKQFTGFPFEFQLVEDKLNALYWQEETFLELLSVLCAIIVLITALGIIGLISFTTELRKKEIALRKISGAKIQAILLLLARQFTALLLLASLVAVPIGYYLSEEWLANFELHIGFSIWPFAITLPACLLFTALAIAYHASKAARANPVDALRSE